MVVEHITNLPCAKHSGKRAHTQMLVVHSMETPLANGYALSLTQNWLGKMYQANGALIEASANVNVGPDTLIRSVHTDYAAWHASWANGLSVGYEQTGYAAYSREQWLSSPGRDQIDRLAREMALDAAAYGIPLRWLTATEVKAIRNGDRTVKGLVTHAVIDPGNRTDPGNQYPYDVLLASIKAYAGTATPQSSNITPIPEEGFLMALSDADQNEVLLNLRKVVAMASTEAGMDKGMNEKLDEVVGNLRKVYWNTAEATLLLKSAPPADLAAQIDAAGIAAEVRDELVKLLAGDK